MFKEGNNNLQRIKPDKAKEINVPPIEFLNYKEKTSYVAKKLVSERLKDVLLVTDNMVDERGDFFNFTKKENINYFSKIFSDIAFNTKVKSGYNPKYNGSEYSWADSDYGRVFIEALPAIFQNNLEKEEHTNNLSIIQAWAQMEYNLMGEEDRFSNTAVVKSSFENSLNDKRISVLEKIYLNYIGHQVNQLDADDLKRELPEVYEKFKNEQPKLERFRKEIPLKFNLDLPLLSRKFLLSAKYSQISISSFEDDWSGIEKHCEERLFYLRGEQKKVKPELIEAYNKKVFWGKSPILNDFITSKAGRLIPCRQEINSMEIDQADGEYVIADFSSDYDGVYSVSGSLEAFIKKGDLNSNKTVKARDFSEIKKEVNFSNNQDLASFKLMSSLFFRDALEKKCGIDISQLNLRTQYQFLDFISGYSEDKFNELKEFMDNSPFVESKNNRLKSFLCLELDKNLGNEIVSLGKKLDSSQADLFFSKVASINDLACKEEADLGQLLLKDKQKLDFSVLKSELLKRARDLVIKFSTLADDRLNDKEQKNIFVELEKIKTEMILFSSLLKSAKENGQNINLETIKDLDLRVKDYGESIESKDKAEILAIAQNNWQSFGNEKLKDVVLSGLDESLKNSKNQKAYILKYKGDVIGFVRFEKTDNDTTYAGSFNVSKDLRGLSIGNDLMEKALMKEGETNVLEATASIKIPAGCSYVEKIGFVADGIIPDYHQTGESLFSIKLDSKNNKEYTLRKDPEKYSNEHLKALAQNPNNLDNLINQGFFVLRFDLKSQMSEYQNTLNRLLAKTDDRGDKLEATNDKYALTRYFYDKQESPQGDIRYLAFERNH